MNERLAALVIKNEATIRQAMQALDSGGVEIALMVDHDGTFIGTVSDGDIRRALLHGRTIDDLVSPHVNRNPHVVAVSAPRGDVLEIMRRWSLEQIPIIDDDRRLVGLHVMQELLGAPAYESLVVQIPLAVPALTGNEARYVNECLETNFVSSVGPFVDRFEREFAAAVGASHAVACASGTAALHVALVVAGVQPGDTVAVPSFTFIASANAVRYIGAEPLLVDSESTTWNIDGAMLHDELESRARKGASLPRAIEVVHVLGHPADLEPLVAINERWGIPIIEDAAEALGARYRTGAFAGRQVGTIGQLGCFSFNGNKIMTTGGGGMIVTDDAALAARARHLTTQAKLPGHGYVHDEVGFNYRLTNVAAAIGVAQLEQLPAFVGAKRRAAGVYDAGLAGLSLELPPRAPWADPTYWLYSVLLRDAAVTPKHVVDELVADGTQARPLWAPLHQQAPYREVEILGGDVAENIHRRGVSLPSSVTIAPEEQARVISQLHALLPPE